jgi:hypothetical protein
MVISTGIIFLFSLILTYTPAVAGDNQKSLYEGGIKLNPDCQIRRMSNGTVIVIMKDQEGTEVKHQFNDIYADLLLAAHRKLRLPMIVNNLSKKYYMSEDDCRREIKHALNVLSEWNIIMREENVALH